MDQSAGSPFQARHTNMLPLLHYNIENGSLDPGYTAYGVLISDLSSAIPLKPPFLTNLDELGND